jgi:predicted alpha/beta-fold hydrolase
MPIVRSFYKPPFLFKNGFYSTVYSGLIRRVNGLSQQRERIRLPDGDFLDLDWSFAHEQSDKLIILLHGLEGDAKRPYMTGTAKLFNANGYDALCVNFRGCSGEENLMFRSYHSGETEDLHEIIQHVLSTKKYSEIYLKGFSLGGNVALKYLGERQSIPKQIKGAVAVSVPCHLAGSSLELHKFKNVLYHDRFKKHLIQKLKIKQKIFPNRVSSDDIKRIVTLKDFDDVYTSKAHGFKDADDYYEKCSSLQFLHNIDVPTLIINAKNDSFLSPDCYPINLAASNSNLYLEVPDYGGHVGFWDKRNLFFNEYRSLQFIMN